MSDTGALQAAAQGRASTAHPAAHDHEPPTPHEVGHDLLDAIDEEPTPAPTGMIMHVVNRRPWDYSGILGRGVLMGAADVVPGVSGGTIAFITGIYSELIYSIRMLVSPRFLRPFFALHWGEAFRIANLWFLVALLSGIGLAVVTLAPGIEWMLEHQPVLIWSFFFGLVAASVLTVRDYIPRWTSSLVLLTVAGAIFAWWLVGLVPVATPLTWWFLLLSGAIAVCAMILPGISGSFILLLLGQYDNAIQAVNERDFATLFWLAVGCFIGIVTFAQVLNWLFKRYHDITVAVLIGFMVGSLRKVWPWKVEEGDTVTNVLPPLTIDGAFNTEVALALGAMALGLGSVLLIERLARRA